MDFEKMARDFAVEHYLPWSDDGPEARAFVKALRAAFAAGREAMREDCVAAAERWKGTTAGDEIAARICALPGKEGE